VKIALSLMSFGFCVIMAIATFGPTILANS
jgi:hypothetical protein